MQVHMSQINTLQASMDFNQAKRDSMKAQLKHLSNEARKIMDDIPKRVKHKEKIKFLGMLFLIEELVVKNHFLELENNEMQYNLKLQEKMNKILRKEIDRLKGIMKNNNIKPANADQEDQDECIEEENYSESHRQKSQPSENSYDFSKKRLGSREKGSKDKLHSKAERGIRAKSPGLNTQDLGKIQQEIERVQDVINSVPAHIKDKAKSSLR